MTPQPEQSVQIESRAEWRAWLMQHHVRTEGVWLITFKKSANPDRHVPYGDTVEEALCFGWVDSKPRKLDTERSMLWFAPRKAKTGWSRPNKERIERLIRDQLMTPAGQAKIDAAIADGSWVSLDGVEALEIPADLQAALDQYPFAAAHFAAFPRSVKRGILEWILVAKRAETRRKRIEETARLANENQRANQWRG